MKLYYAIPILLMLMGASCQRKPDVEEPKYPANTLVECPELKEFVIDQQIDGVLLEKYYLEKSGLNKQYADCATIHNELVRFIKQQQKKK